MRNLQLFATMFAASLLAGCAGPQTRADAPMQSTIDTAVAASAKPAMPANTEDPNRATLVRLERLAPDADPGVLALALEARGCAIRNGQADTDARLAVIDYSLPSTQKRLWVFDIDKGTLLHREHVSHGQGSGENLARKFSNIEGSYQTSLGLYRTAETYVGGNGYSLRMDGLDPGFNDAARQRAIVMHGAWYANPELIRSQGRLGRSQGCPALREQVARMVIDDLKQRHLIFAYADDAAWLQRGRSFACDGRSASQILTAARAPQSGGGTLATAISAR